MRGVRVTLPEIMSAAGAMLGVVFGGAAWLDSRAQRSDKEQDKRDRRTDERIEMWAARHPPPFVRPDVYERDRSRTEEKLEVVDERLTNLSDYVMGDGLPKSIASAIANADGVRLHTKG